MLMFIEKWLVLVFLFSIVLFAVPVSADPLEPTVTRINITQNGTPITSSVEYTMECYGNSRIGNDTRWLAQMQMNRILNNSGPEDYLYSYSNTCNPGLCDIYENYDAATMMNFSHCNISGKYQGQQFVIKNFSNSPRTSSDLIVENLYAKWAASDSDFLGSYILPESKDDLCTEKRDIDPCVQDKLSPSDRNPSLTPKDAEALCQKMVDDYNTCIENNATKVNKSEVGNSIIFYEMDFDLSQSDNFSGLQNTGVHPTNITHLGPIELLYCGILNFFGVTC